MGWPTLVKSDGLAGWISFCSPYANDALGLHHLMLGTTKGKMLYDRDLFFFIGNYQLSNRKKTFANRGTV